MKSFFHRGLVFVSARTNPLLSLFHRGERNTRDAGAFIYIVPDQLFHSKAPTSLAEYYESVKREFLEKPNN